MNQENITYPISKRGPKEHEIKDQIVMAATAHFSQYGYNKTTVSDLARSIGFSKAYIYKFFDSKQAIGEQICTNCLSEIEKEVHLAIDTVDSPSEKIKVLFTSIVQASLRLFFQDRKLYEIAASASSEKWASTITYENRIKNLLKLIIEQGRITGEFESETLLDDTVKSIYLVMRPYIHPLLLAHSIEDDLAVDAAIFLSNIILKTLSD